MDTAWTGAAPSGPIKPYLTATITDASDDNSIGPNAVLMTLSAPGLIKTAAVKEFVTDWAFNLNPGLLQGGSYSATISEISRSGWLGEGSPYVTLGVNNKSVLSSHGYDLLFDLKVTGNPKRQLREWRFPDRQDRDARDQPELVQRLQLQREWVQLRFGGSRSGIASWVPAQTKQARHARLAAASILAAACSRRKFPNPPRMRCWLVGSASSASPGGA